jgi:hypothetical protein
LLPAVHDSTIASAPTPFARPVELQFSQEKHSDRNGVYTLNDRLDPARNHVRKELPSAGYQTAMIAKWHLASDPIGFDYRNILPGQA